MLGSYNLVKCNCETVACWCSTGSWATLQVLDVILKMRQASGTVGTIAVAGMFVLTQTVTVPATGIWGFLGSTQQVAMTVASANPVMVTAFAGRTAGVVLYSKYRETDMMKGWVKISKKLNNDFEAWHEAVDSAYEVD